MTQHGTGDEAPRTAEVELGRGHFDGLIGTVFPTMLDGAQHELMLIEIEELQGSPREGGGFRLEFLGASGSSLPQGIYALPVDGASRDIFIVPRGPNPGGGGFLYEAVFN